MWQPAVVLWLMALRLRFSSTLGQAAHWGSAQQGPDHSDPVLGLRQRLPVVETQTVNEGAGAVPQQYAGNSQNSDDGQARQLSFGFSWEGCDFHGLFGCRHASRSPIPRTRSPILLKADTGLIGDLYLEEAFLGVAAVVCGGKRVKAISIVASAQIGTDFTNSGPHGR